MKLATPNTILQQAKTQAFLVSSLVNIRYLTGLDLSAGFVLILPRSIKLFVDGRYSEVAKSQCRKGIVVLPYEDVAKSLKNVKECGFESETMTVKELRIMKRKIKNTKFVQRVGVIEYFRRAKQPEEIRSFQKAQKMTQEVMKKIPRALKLGITEKRLAWDIECWMRELGADGVSFEPIVAFGRNSSRPHHHPTDRKLTKGDIVQIDCGAKYQGYCADQSAVFFTAKPTKEQQKVYDAVKKAKELAMKAVKVGVPVGDLDAIARESLQEDGYEQYFTHSLGHGVGLEIHEGVTLSSRAPKTKLLKNEIITIEPGVYIPGKFGIRLEEEVIVN